MKVAFDLSPLYSGHKLRGIGFYTQRLVTAMKPLVKEQTGLELELVKLTDKLRFIQADLIHYPYFSPFFLTLPSRPLAPSVVTIHDLIPVKYPENFPPGLRGKLRWQRQKSRLKKIKAVITDSLLWQKEIAQLTGFPKEKIFVVPLSAGSEFKVVDKKESARIKQKYQLPEVFVLYVGDVNWNKNISGLIKAFKQIFTSEVPPCRRQDSSISKVKLVLVGKAFLDKSLKETKEILQLIKKLNLVNQIKLLGYVPTRDLVRIYNLAAVYCQPSFDEGFGLPILEAMACGCPVVAAKAGSLPEVCGQAAVMVNPQNSQLMAEGLKKLIIDKKARDEWRKKGFARAKSFSWEKTALQTIHVYQKVLANAKD